jgi:CPA1 family monovalent cation:H+ antiporter
VTRLSLDATLLSGVLCFMLFASSINLNIRVLGEEKWVILTLAVGATPIAAVLIGLAVSWSLGLIGIGIGLIFALVFGALISPTDPIAALATIATGAPCPWTCPIPTGRASRWPPSAFPQWVSR